MSFFSRGLFVIAGIVAGSVCINYFVLGNPIDIGLPNARLGAWKEGQVRTACFPALISPKQDRGNPQLPAGDHRITWQDHDRMVDMTAALHCYVVTQRNAVCNPDNRAYVVDYIKKYYAKRDAMLDIAARYGNGEERIVRDLWDGPNARAIAVALDNHFHYGRLNKSDFGWSAPAALKPLMDKYAGARDNCVQERPWTAVKM